MNRKYTKELLANLVKESFSIAEIMRKLNLTPRGSNYSRMRSRIIEELNLDVSHFKSCLTNTTWNKKSKEDFIKTVLILNGLNYNTFSIKKRVLEYNLLENKCAKCKQTDIWMEQKLILQLDHINGNPRDNRLKNLRILCPNCHTQTKTYAGKKREYVNVGELS